MAQAVKVYHDQVGKTLVVWFGDPLTEYEVEETGDEVVLMMNDKGEVIGFEKLNFVPTSSEPLGVVFETLSA